MGYLRLIVVAGLLAVASLPAQATCPYSFDSTSIAIGNVANPAPVMGNFNYILNCPNFLGSVGVGTSTPLFKVEVIAPNDGIRILSGSSSNYARLAIGRASHELSVGVAAATGQFFNTGSVAGDGVLVAVNNLQLGSSQMSAPTLTLSTSGNVGIGTTSPANALDVSGNIHATGTITGSSDVRLKRDVRTLDDGALDIVLGLRPVTYRWRDRHLDTEDGQQIGFIAQDVERVLPAVVVTGTDPQKLKSLNSIALIPVLTKAIQELKAANDREASEIGRLQERVAALERQSAKRAAARAIRRRARG